MTNQIADSGVAAALNKDEKDLPFYLKKNVGFGVARPEDDLLHPQLNAKVSDDTLTETQYFGFDIPEENIKALGYIWHHPNLHLVTGGVWVFQGSKRNQLACEMFDIRTFMHDRVLDKDLHDYRLANGYGVKIIEPLKKHHVTYSDPDRKNSWDVHYEAVNDPVMFGNGKHFDQPMRAKGELMLRGRRYDIDCFTLRDRSFGSPRQETLNHLPPAGWTHGIFGPDFSFACTVFDAAELMPEWKGEYAVPEDRRIMGGWVIKDGDKRLMTHCAKRTVRDPVTLHPTRIEMDVTDDRQCTYHLVGTVKASCEWMYLTNMRNILAATTWECDGRIAYGEAQDGQFPDFIHAFMP